MNKRRRYKAKAKRRVRQLAAERFERQRPMLLTPVTIKFGALTVDSTDADIAAYLRFRYPPWLN